MYIGMTNSIRVRIKKHNTGIGSVSTEPFHLRPYALLAYICGFDLRRELMGFVEQKWKYRRDTLIQNGNNDPIAWADVGTQIITEMNTGNDAAPCGLKLVCMFKQ